MVPRSRKEAAGVRQQIADLFTRAAVVAASDKEAARALVTKARKMASRKRVSLRAFNRSHCHKCCVYFTAKSLRVRTRPNHVVYACLSCGHVTRLRKN